MVNNYCIFCFPNNNYNFFLLLGIFEFGLKLTENQTLCHLLVIILQFKVVLNVLQK